MRTLLLALLAPVLALAFLASTAAPSAAERAAATPPRVVAHDVKVRLLPEQKRLVAEDTLTVEAPEGGGELRLVLWPSLALTGPVERGTERIAVTREGERLSPIPVPGGRSTLTLRYGGELFDAVEKSGALTWVAGDGTRGLVSTKGVYLAGSSLWVPTGLEDGLARYEVEAWIPEPFQVVTQGTVPERSTLVSAGAADAGSGPAPTAAPAGAAGPTTTWNALKARSVLPTDSLTLVAGPYVTQGRVVEGVTIATWFYEPEGSAAPLWLDAMAEVVKRYARLLGPYPHPKFDIVANFFQTGYGMPSFTLLGDEVLRYVTMGAKRSGGKIPPGYLDHEYVHGWYGNGLFVDYTRGNWCEGLTTYCSNYYAKELESATEASAHRRSVLERFALRIHGPKDAPVRAFVQKTEDTDNDIGYGKASLLFHRARRLLGDEAFWRVLREFTQARVGTVVSWDDWLAAFDAAGAGVRAQVQPYLDRPGLPGLTAPRVEWTPAEGGAGGTLTLTVEQAPASDGGGPWPLALPVRLEGVDDAAAEQQLDVSAGAGTLRLTLPRKPSAVALDPVFHTLRRIAADDLPPSLERTFQGPDGVVLLRGPGVEDSKVLQALAQQIVETKGFRRVAADFDLAAHAGAALVLEIAPEGARSATLGGSTYTDPGTATLVSRMEAGPAGPRARTVYTAFSAAAAERASRLAFYGWDPWVVFQGGRPVARDPRLQEAVSTSLRLAAAPGDDLARVKDDLARLCGESFEGRWPGSAGHARCEEWLAEQLKAWSGKPAAAIPWEAGGLERLSPRDLTVVAEDDSTTALPGAFRPLSFSAERDPAMFPVPDAFEVVDWSSPDPLELAVDANKREQPIVFYVLQDKAVEALAPFLDVVGDLTPAATAELAKPGRDGKPRPPPVLPTWIAGRRARVAPALAKVNRVVLAVDEATGRTLRTAQEAGSRVQLDLRFANAVRGSSRGSGTAPPAKGPPSPEARKEPALVLMAHYDAFGKQGGALWQGADDNASGVACLLEVLRRLSADSVRAQAGAPHVIVVFTSGEEWGLRGARTALESLKERYDVQALINVDSIGRARSKPVHVIGLSTHAGLGKRVQAALEAEGLASGKDIDAFAYPHGADHWPFHEAGIPAVTVWATEYALMNTADDTLDKVEPEGIVKVAAALARLLADVKGLVEAARAR